MGLFGGESTIDEVERAELPADLDVDDFTPVEAVTSTLKGLFRGYTKYDDEYIVGEVGDLSTESDNLYFSITATHSDGTLNCVVWQSNRETLDIDIEQEMLVAVRGELRFFEGGGHPSLEVTDARLVGESAYWQRIQALEATVRAEGLFDDARKTDLPSFPEAVGVVTAAGSDAEADLIESIKSRYPGVDIISHDTSVQGDAAPAELTEAIAAVDGSRADVLVVTRGGGSDVALRSFNEESVVRSVADATTPTVAAVGHETDTPLVDKVADVRAKTPTAAGAVVVADKATYDEQITEARDGIQAAFATQVSRWQHQQRTGVQDAYETVCAEWLDEQARAIDTATARHTTQWLQETTSDIDTAYTTLVNDWLTEQRSDIQRATTRLEQAHTFEAETAGLRRRNVILVAIIITLLVLLGLALAVITGII